MWRNLSLSKHSYHSSTLQLIQILARRSKDEKKFFISYSFGNFSAASDQIFADRTLLYDSGSKASCSLLMKNDFHFTAIANLRLLTRARYQSRLDDEEAWNENRDEANNFFQFPAEEVEAGCRATVTSASDVSDRAWLVAAASHRTADADRFLPHNSCLLSFSLQLFFIRFSAS